MHELWSDLRNHRRQTSHVAIATRFDEDPERFATFSAECDGMLLDFSKTTLDVKAIDLVINLEMARSGDDYVHRIGRTGRAGASGTAISFIDHTEWNLKAAIERYLQVEMDVIVNKALAGKYKGPKKVKSNGKAVGSKSKKSKNSSAKNGPKKNAKKGQSSNKKTGKQTSGGGLRKPKVIGDGSAPFKPKKKVNPDDE